MLDVRRQKRKRLQVAGFFFQRIFLLQLFFSLVSSVFCLQSFAQYTFTGKVMDSVTFEPLPFVTILYNHSTDGTRTDMDGKFSFTSPSSFIHITISYVGYKTRDTDLTFSDSKTPIKILLQTEDQELEDVTILSGENPANRIIREAVKHSKENDPANLDAYSFSSYNKFLYTADASAAEKVKSGDTTRELMEYLKGNYLMIMESQIETIFKKPGLKKQFVIATKVSGLKDPNFSLDASQLQPFSFYDHFISLVEIDYLNPVSEGSSNLYFFNIDDTTYSGTDTIYHISFKPRKGKTFMSLKGTLFINSSSYAIQHVIAEPFDTAGLAMIVKVEQDYNKPDGIHWFPNQYNTNIHYNNFLKPGLKVFFQGRTYIDSVKINPDIHSNVFDGIGQQIESGAGTRDENYWNTVRPDLLTEKEQNTYHDMDSLGSARHLDTKLRIVTALMLSKFPIGPISIDISNIVKINAKENYRFGIGLMTNEKISKSFTLAGYGGYGLNDHVWKYGANLKLIFSEQYNSTLSFQYTHDYEESGGVDFYHNNFFGNTQKWRNTIINRFDLTDRYSISVTGRNFRFLNFEFSAFEAQKLPAFDYTYHSPQNHEPVSAPFIFTGIKLSCRYAYKEKVVKSFGQNFEAYDPFPVLWFNVTHGMKVLNGQFDYWKFDLKFYYDFPSKRFGETYLQGYAGYATSTLPVSELFSCKGNYTLFGLYSYSNFQTMRVNEFIYDQYAALFWEQDFGSLIFKKGKFRPKVLFSTSAAIGALHDPELHSSILFKQPEKPYTESGLVVNNIVSKKFLGAVRVGIGIGGYYRWGYFILPQWKDNLALKVAFYVSG